MIMHPKENVVPKYPKLPYIIPPMAGPIVDPKPLALSMYPIYFSFSSAISIVANEYEQVMIPADPMPYIKRNTKLKKKKSGS